jgi:hypothetical protein
MKTVMMMCTVTLALVLTGCMGNEVRDAAIAHNQTEMTRHAHAKEQKQAAEISRAEGFKALLASADVNSRALELAIMMDGIARIVEKAGGGAKHEDAPKLQAVPQTFGERLAELPFRIFDVAEKSLPYVANVFMAKESGRTARAQSDDGARVALGAQAAVTEQFRAATGAVERVGVQGLTVAGAAKPSVTVSGGGTAVVGSDVSSSQVTTGGDSRGAGATGPNTVPCTVTTGATGAGGSTMLTPTLIANGGNATGGNASAGGAPANSGATTAGAGAIPPLSITGAPAAAGGAGAPVNSGCRGG